MRGHAVAWVCLGAACAQDPRGAAGSGAPGTTVGEAPEALEGVRDTGGHGGDDGGGGDGSSGPDYEGLFGRVHRFALRMDAADHDAMMAEMGDLASMPFGMISLMNDLTPEEIDALRVACHGLVSGQSCRAEVRDVDFAGTCRNATDGALTCTPGFPERDSKGELFATDPSYWPVDVEVDGVALSNAGFRLKGNSSLMGAWALGVGKLPFRLDFGRFIAEGGEDPELFGFEELSFANGYGDPTLMRDRLASWVLEDRGVPAARNGYAWVTLDTGDGPRTMGLYVVTEDPSDVMIERLWGEDAGNLYKPEGACADLTCFDAATFDKESNQEIGDWSDVEALIAAVNADRTDRAAWRAGLEAVLDVDGYLRWLAVNTAIRNGDTYGFMSHNYYLYGAPADGGRFAWIPWDNSMAFLDGPMGSDDPLLYDVSGDWPLIRWVLDEPAYMDAYKGHLTDALDGAMAEGTFEARVAELQAILREELYAGDGEEPGSTFMGDELDLAAAVEGSGGLLDFVGDWREEVAAAAR